MWFINALQFYNDEHDTPVIQIKKFRKPRKSKYITKKNYRSQLIDWEISLFHDVNVKSKYNNMT